ncbi:MAG: universal stress protein, partial [Nitrospiraceae bacterium]|nr:universal stress protein [Nitrospiraceae bacterium]
LKKTGLNLIVLCHIIPREEVGFVPFGGYLKKEADELKEQARIKFEDWQRAIARAGLESRVVIGVGEPVPEVIRTARDEHVDMLVAGKGSSTLDIAKRSPVPLLVHSYMAQFEAEGKKAVRENKLVFDRPLLAAGAPAASRKALSLLESLAGAVEKSEVAHVLEKKALSDPGIGKIKEEEMLRLKGYCDVLQKTGIAAEPHLLAGKPEEELINEARAAGCSMIIAATSDKEPPENAGLGSMARKLCETSEFPLLLVPVTPLSYPEDLD